MDSDASRFEVGALLTETMALLVSNWWRVAIAVGVLCAIGALTDLKGSGSSSNLLYTFIAIGFQIWLTDAVLTATGAKQQGANAGNGVRVTLVSQLGILLGLVLLIVPGVIAFVRWSMALPIALSSGDGVIESIKQSWRRSEGHFWPIFVLLMLVYVPSVGISIALAIIAEPMPVVASILMNGTISLGLAVGWHASLATFLAGEPRTAALEQVFA